MTLKETDELQQLYKYGNSGYCETTTDDLIEDLKMNVDILLENQKVMLDMIRKLEGKP